MWFDNGPDYFSSGLRRIIEYKNYGYINKQNRIVIKPQFEWAERFQGNYAIVGKSCRKKTMGEHYFIKCNYNGVINKKGQFLIPMIYQDIRYDGKDKFTVNKDGKSKKIQVGPKEKLPTAKRLKAKAARWLKRLRGRRFYKSIRERKSGNGFKLSSLNYKRYTYKSNGYRIVLGSYKIILKNANLQDLRNEFYWYSLEKFPVFLAKGWNVSLSPPESSLTKGLKILSYKNGKIKVRFKGYFYAINGTKDGKYPKDVGLPKDAYFQIRKKIYYTIIMDVPLHLKNE